MQRKNLIPAFIMAARRYCRWLGLRPAIGRESERCDNPASKCQDLAGGRELTLVNSLRIRRWIWVGRGLAMLRRSGPELEDSTDQGLELAVSTEPQRAAGEKGVMTPA